MTTHLTPQPNVKKQGLPPLENGDRLTRPEFEQRYAAAPPPPQALHNLCVKCKEMSN